MTINKSINEILSITVGVILDTVVLELTKSSTSRIETLLPTVVSSSQRLLTLEADTSELPVGEYSMSVISDAVYLKTFKVEVLEYIDLPEYNTNRLYDEYTGE